MRSLFGYKNFCKGPRLRAPAVLLLFLNSIHTVRLHIPLLPTTRWQGIMIEIGLWPTYRPQTAWPRHTAFPSSLPFLRSPHKLHCSLPIGISQRSSIRLTGMRFPSAQAASVQISSNCFPRKIPIPASPSHFPPEPGSFCLCSQFFFDFPIVLLSFQPQAYRSFAISGEFDTAGAIYSLLRNTWGVTSL